MLNSALMINFLLCKCSLTVFNGNINVINLKKETEKESEKSAEDNFIR